MTKALLSTKINRAVMSRKEERQKLQREMKHDMYRAMVDLLGRGYVPEYCESAASEFIQIAESYAEAAAAARSKGRWK